MNTEYVGTSSDDSTAPLAGRLTLLVAGSVNAALAPFWLNWLRHANPGLEVSVGITGAAERFVTLDAVAQMTTGRVFRDSWDGMPQTPTHVEIEHHADFFGIYPATLNTVSRLAHGAADTPMLLALQLTSKSIAIADAFPVENEMTRSMCDLLGRRSNVRFVEHVPAYSVSTREWSASTGFHLPNLLRALVSLREESPAEDA